MSRTSPRIPAQKIPPTDPGATNYLGYWRASYEAGDPPWPWGDVPAQNQAAWRSGAAEVLAAHAPAELRAAMAEVRHVRGELAKLASAWTASATRMETVREGARNPIERMVLQAKADLLRDHAEQVRALAPGAIVLETDAPPSAEPHQAELIPEHADWPDRGAAENTP